MKQSSNNAGKIVLMVLGGILIGVLLGSYIFCVTTHTKFSELFGSNSSSATSVSQEASETSSTQATMSTSTSSTTTTSRETTIASNSGTKKLILPDESDYIDPHDVEIWSDEIEPDEYINIRYGPSKDSYAVVKKVQNGTMGKGLTGSVDGWVLVRVDGVEGWVRDDLVIHYEDGMPDGIAKPVLYLYPEKKTDVKVKLALKDAKFSCTYPNYGKGWNVTANHNGKIINKADSKEYSYLYWELDADLKYDFSEGFVVAGKDTAEFLQKTLAKMGLKPKEYNEFIVYWLPRMQNNEYNLISFQSSAYTDNVTLNISPKPDSVLRVNMAYKPLSKKEAATQKKLIKTQKFPKFERKGFTVVEWGGEEIK